LEDGEKRKGGLGRLLGGKKKGLRMVLLRRKCGEKLTSSRETIINGGNIPKENRRRLIVGRPKKK